MDNKLLRPLELLEEDNIPALKLPQYLLLPPYQPKEPTELHQELLELKPFPLPTELRPFHTTPSKPDQELRLKLLRPPQEEPPPTTPNKPKPRELPQVLPPSLMLLHLTEEDPPSLNQLELPPEDKPSLMRLLPEPTDKLLI